MFGIRTRVQFDTKILVFSLSSDNVSMKYKRNGAKKIFRLGYELHILYDLFYVV